MSSSGNMAGFYIAHQLGIDGPQLAIARRHAGLEAALELLQLPTPTHRHALLGCVEEGVWPLAAQRQRVGLPKDAAMFETSHRSEEHTSELQSLMRISYAVFCLKKKKLNIILSASQTNLK